MKTETKALPSAAANPQVITPTAPALTTATGVEKYEEKLPAIKKFLYKGVVDIRKQETAAITPKDHDHVLQRKIQILAEFEQLQVSERNFQRSTSMISLRMALGVVISITLGVTLNIYNIKAIVFSSILLFLRFGTWTINTAYSTYSEAAGKESVAIRNQTEDHEFFEQRKKGGGAGAVKQSGSMA
jgi:hypothetical protein